MFLFGPFVDMLIMLRITKAVAHVRRIMGKRVENFKVEDIRKIEIIEKPIVCLIGIC